VNAVVPAQCAAIKRGMQGWRIFDESRWCSRLSAVHGVLTGLDLGIGGLVSGSIVT